jgi:apolipoprotein N-acyltransferase
MQFKDSRYYLVTMAVLSALLLWLGWPMRPLPFLLFFGFVPLLAIENHIAKGAYKRPWLLYFGLIYLALFLWNFGTTWWVYNSTPEGAIMMLFANSFLMSLPFLLFRLTKKTAGASWGLLGFVLYWITFEYVHLNWEFSWPWLTLGNAFSIFPQWVQWYEFTGVFGGTLWILLANIAIYQVLFRHSALFRGQVNIFNFILVIFWISMPIVYSYILYFNYEEVGQDVEVVVVQPNIDPYTEKFVGSDHFIPYEEQVERFIDLSKKALTNQTRFLVWPETAIDNVFDVKDIRVYPIIEEIDQFRKQYPGVSLLTGLTSFKRYPKPQEVTITARYRSDIGNYDVFNSAFFLNDEGNHALYHKSKLVPGPEIIPYGQFLKPLTRLSINLGGTSGGLGRQDERTVFYNSEGKGVAPSICYESIYGDFMAEFVRNGAEMIFVITNDGWWGETPGHRQHLQYATLRAIETRRSIARSANTGISAFINQKGDIIQATNYWEQDVIRAEITANQVLTFYAEHGDYIARTAAWLAVLVFLAGFVKSKLKE